MRKLNKPNNRTNSCNFSPAWRNNSEGRVCVIPTKNAKSIPMHQRENELESSRRDYLDCVIILVMVIPRHHRIILLYNVKAALVFKICNHWISYNPFEITAVIISKTSKTIIVSSSFISNFPFPNQLIRKSKIMRTFSHTQHKIPFCNRSLIARRVISIQIRKRFFKILALLNWITTIVVAATTPIHLLHMLSNSS